MSAPAIAQTPPRTLAAREAAVLTEEQDRAFLDMLRTLSPEAWEATTDCAPWKVRDIVAHVLGWAEALTSITEAGHQLVAARRRVGEFGNPVDAQNQVQVDERAHLAPDELLERLETTLPRFSRFCRRAGRVGRVLPLYDGTILGLTNVNYLLNTIFTRDHFMHRIDIARATGAELVVGPSEARLIEDVLCDWARRRKVHGLVTLTGPAGGAYLLGGPSEAAIEGDAIVFARVTGGRGHPDELQISGDVKRAERWLRDGCPF